MRRSILFGHYADTFQYRASHHYFLHFLFPRCTVLLPAAQSAQHISNQLSNDTNATIATAPIADLSVAIDAYVSHLEAEFQERVNQAKGEKKRLTNLLAIVEQESLDKAQAEKHTSKEIEREQTYLRQINFLSTTPLRAIIGLTNRIAVDSNNEKVLEELAMFAEQLRFLLDETSTT